MLDAGNGLDMIRGLDVDIRMQFRCADADRDADICPQIPVVDAPLRPQHLHECLRIEGRVRNLLAGIRIQIADPEIPCRPVDAQFIRRFGRDGRLDGQPQVAHGGLQDQGIEHVPDGIQRPDRDRFFSGADADEGNLPEVIRNGRIAQHGTPVRPIHGQGDRPFRQRPDIQELALGQVGRRPAVPPVRFQGHPGGFRVDFEDQGRPVVPFDVKISVQVFPQIEQIGFRDGRALRPEDVETEFGIGTAVQAFLQMDLVPAPRRTDPALAVLQDIQADAGTVLQRVPVQVRRPVTVRQVRSGNSPVPFPEPPDGPVHVPDPQGSAPERFAFRPQLRQVEGNVIPGEQMAQADVQDGFRSDLPDGGTG